MDFNLLIFDLDGTLVDTAQDLADALNHAVTPAGVPPLTQKQTTDIVGHGISHLVSTALGTEHQDYLEKAIGRFISHYNTNLTVHSKTYPTVEATLNDLRYIPKAVLSNKRTDMCVRILEELGLIHHFELVVGGDLPPQKKPSPQAVQYILDKTNTQAEQAMIIGDSNVDIEAGLACGLSTVGVTYGFRNRSFLTNADHIINSMQELIPIVRQTGSSLNRREEQCYIIPEIYEKYIFFKVSTPDGLVRSELIEFSESGLLFKHHEPLSIGSVINCTLAIPKSLTVNIPLSLLVTHCSPFDGQSLIGAEIDKVLNEMWFKVFKKIHRIMAHRQGEIF